MSLAGEEAGLKARVGVPKWTVGVVEFFRVLKRTNLNGVLGKIEVLRKWTVILTYTSFEKELIARLYTHLHISWEIRVYKYPKEQVRRYVIRGWCWLGGPRPRDYLTRRWSRAPLELRPGDVPFLFPIASYGAARALLTAQDKVLALRNEWRNKWNFISVLYIQRAVQIRSRRDIEQTNGPPSRLFVFVCETSDRVKCIRYYFPDDSRSGWSTASMRSANSRVWLVPLRVQRRTWTREEIYGLLEYVYMQVGWVG